MVSLGMKGPYDLTTKSVNEVVTRKSAGNYALGYKNDKGVFIVQYVGRADIDVANRIKQHIGEGYSKFKYDYATSPKAAFEKECINYHDFGGSQFLDNNIHPDRPNGSSWKCPRCTIFN